MFRWDPLHGKVIALALSTALFAVILPLGAISVAAQPSVLMQRVWGGNYSDTAQAVTTDQQGSIYLAGTTSSYGPYSPGCDAISILKYSALGSLLSQRLWTNGSLVQVASIGVDPSGDVYIAGSVYTNNCNGYWSGLLVKLDSGGNLAWAKTISQATDSQFNGLAVDASGNAFVTGLYYTGPAGSNDVLIMKFNSTGGLVWQKAWGGNSYDYGSGITLDSADNLYIAGTTNSFGPSGNNMVLLKLDSSGNLLFQKITGSGAQTGKSVGVDSSGNIYEVGSTSIGGQAKILLLKFDPTGGLSWQKTWGGSRTDIANGLVVDSSGNLDIAGYTNSYGAGGTCFNPPTNICNDILMLKLDSSANLLSQLVYGSPGVNDQALGVADSFGSPIAAGYVSAGPPYWPGSGNTTLVTSSYSVSSAGNSTLGLPTPPIVDTHGGSVYTTIGSQNYSASQDEFMIKYGDQPRLSFAIAPSKTGTISFNGTIYAIGQTFNIPAGNAAVIATPASGYSFTRWNETGGVFVSNSTSSTTQVTVAGSGTLTAQFQQTTNPGPATDYTSYYAVGGAIAAAAVLATIFLYLKKRKPAPGPTTITKPA